MYSIIDMVGVYETRSNRYFGIAAGSAQAQRHLDVLVIETVSQLGASHPALRACRAPDVGMPALVH